MDVDWSRPIWEKTGMNEILGLPMSQNGFVVPFLSELAKVARPSHVAEIGTGFGGLTALIATFSDITTFDLKNPKYNFDSPCREDISFVKGDVFDECHDAVVEALRGYWDVREDVCWLLCDGGDKNREVETFAAFLKPGDVIAAHDFAPTNEWWNWNEIDEQRVEKVAREQNLVTIPELQYDRKAAWWVRRKAS